MPSEIVEKRFTCPVVTRQFTSFHVIFVSRHGCHVEWRLSLWFAFFWKKLSRGSDTDCSHITGLFWVSRQYAAERDWFFLEPATWYAVTVDNKRSIVGGNPSISSPRNPIIPIFVYGVTYDSDANESERL